MMNPFDAEFAGLAEYVGLYRHLRWQVVPAGMPGETQTYKRPLITVAVGPRFPIG